MSKADYYKLCDTNKCPKDELVKELNEQTTRLLNANKQKSKANSKTYAFYKKIIKVLAMAFFIAVVEVILALAYGKDGVIMLFNFIKGVFGK